MGLLLGVLRREFMLQPRRRYFYWRRFGLIGFLLCWAAGHLLLSATRGRAMTGGLALFSSLAQVATVVVFLLAPFVAGDLVMREKKERTLPLLYLTALTPAHLLAAKLATALLTTGALTLGVLPLVLFSVSLGGIATAQVLLAVALLGCTTFTMTALGLWAGTRARNSQELVVSLVTVALVGGVVLPACLAVLLGRGTLLRWLAFWPAEWWLAMLSPYLAMRQVIEGADLTGPGLACLACLGLGLLFLEAAARALPQVLTEDSATVSELPGDQPQRQIVGRRGGYPRPQWEAACWGDLFPRFLRLGSASRRSLTSAAVVAGLLAMVLFFILAALDLRQLGTAWVLAVVSVGAVLGVLVLIADCPRAESNPLLWRDYYLRYAGWRWLMGGSVVGTAVLILVFALAGLVSGEAQGGYLHRCAIGYSWTMVGLCAGFCAFGCPVMYARCLDAERANRTLDLLLTTDLEPEDILNAKQWALFLTFAPWLLMTLLGGLGLLWWVAYNRPDAVHWSAALICALGLAALPLAMAFGYGGLGLWLALRRPRVATVGVLGALIGGLTAQGLATTFVMGYAPSPTFSADDPATIAVYQVVGSLCVSIILLFPPLYLGWRTRQSVYRHFRELATDPPP